MESKKIIHVHLKQPPSDGSQEQDFYFGSLRAIYSTLSVEDIGRSYASLTAQSIAKSGGIFENSRCIIRIAEIIRNKRNI